MSLTLAKLRGSFPDSRVWPSTGTETPTAVGDVFGPRPFAPHIPTVGYDYDWHRGIDLPADPLATAATPVYAPAAGCISRLHYQHFSRDLSDSAPGSWDWDEQFEEADADGILAPGVESLGFTYNLVPTVADTSFPASARMRNRTPVHMGGAQDTDLRAWISGSLAALTGDAGFGIAFHDEVNDEYVAVDYDGATLRFHAVTSAGAHVVDGTTSAVADVKWLRILWDQSAGNVLIQHSLTDTRDPSWVTSATLTAPNFTRGQTPTFPAFRWSFYLRKFDTSAAAGTIPLAFVGCVDKNEDIGRFGNWLQVADGTRTWALMHFAHLVVVQGSIVEKGQLLGYMGREGFDDKSGPILEVHTHVEVIPGSDYYYSNDGPVNPLAPGLLPRANVSNNVGVVRSDANDPNADACFLLTITVTRADQDFDINTISLTGDVATRTLNFDTRSGLNADNDVPDQDGVYLVPSAFDEDSATYVLAVYFEKAVVGSTFVSAEVLDAEGTELWSDVA